MRESGGDASRDPIVLAIDQGTTGTTAALYDFSDRSGKVMARVNVEFPQHFPRPGWVEHEPEQIWRSVVDAVGLVLERVPGARSRVAAIGLTNQRETMLLWDRATGEAQGNAIVWQDRRTAERCLELRAAWGERVRRITGLVLDPYFSATKLEFRLQNEPGLRERANSGELCFGTVDSFLVRRIGGPDAPHVMEFTNASRTLLMDIRTGAYSPEICELFGVPEACLPTIVGSAEPVTRTWGFPGLPDGIPVTGIAGDQHAALFGQGALFPGQAKCTYGTGAFLLVNTGGTPIFSSAGMLTTAAWKIGNHVTYAVEGAAFVAGALVQWLRDGLGIISSAGDIEALARSVPDSGGVTFVPALTGLGAPYWAPDARGMISGITRGTSRAHLARATLDAIAHEVSDLLDAVRSDLAASDLPELSLLRVDGGAAKNELLLQRQADLGRVTVERGTDTESTARGAALLAALGAGILEDIRHVGQSFELDREFSPHLPSTERVAERKRYQEEVLRCLSGLAVHRPGD